MIHSTANNLRTSSAHLSKGYQQKPFLDVKLNVVFTFLPHMFDDLHVTRDHMKLIITVMDYRIMKECSLQLPWKLFIWLKTVETNTSSPTATTTNTMSLALYCSNICSLKDKDKVFLLRGLKAYKRRGAGAPFFLKHDTRRSWVVNFTLRKLYFWGKIASCPLNRRLGDLLQTRNVSFFSERTGDWLSSTIQIIIYVYIYI